MWGRYKPIAIVAGVIFLANIIVRILGLTVYRKSDNGQINSGLVFLAVLAVIMVVAAYWWSVRYPSSRALPELGLVLLSATIACVLIGPVFSGALSRLHHPKVSANPFDGGAGLFFSEIWHLLGIGIGGADHRPAGRDGDRARLPGPAVEGIHEDGRVKAAPRGPPIAKARGGIRFAATIASTGTLTGPFFEATVSSSVPYVSSSPRMSVKSGRPSRSPTTRRTTTRCPTSCGPIMPHLPWLALRRNTKLCASTPEGCDRDTCAGRDRA